MLVEARVPLAASTGWAYLKANRRAQDWATVEGAALVHRDDGSIAGASVVNAGGAAPGRGPPRDAAGGASIADAAALVTEGTEHSTDTRARRMPRAPGAGHAAAALEQALAD